MLRFSTIGLVASLSMAGIAMGADKESDLNNLRGNIRVDGSSTVFPITEAIAESFGEAAPTFESPSVSPEQVAASSDSPPRRSTSPTPLDRSSRRK